jgi:hypothetical protein
MKYHVQRMEDYDGDQPLAGNWRYCRASDTDVVIAIENPYMEPDCDGDRVYYTPTFKAFLLLDGGEWRAPTDEEDDEYTDDIYEWLRTAEWRES